MSTTSPALQSARGRILQLTKIFLFSNIRSFLLFYGILTACLIGFPFLIHLIQLGNPLEALRETFASYRFGGMTSSFSSASIIYLFLIFHKAVHRPSPGVYTLLPATAGEKLASLLLGMLSIKLLVLGTTLLLNLLFSSLAGTPSCGIEWELLSYTLIHQAGHAIVIGLLIGLCSLFLTLTCLVHCRKFIIGAFTSIAVHFVLMYLGVWSTLAIADLAGWAAHLPPLSSQSILLSTELLLLLPCALLGYLLHWRLKTLQQK